MRVCDVLCSTAEVRSQEASQPSPLFRDPYAGLLVGTDGKVRPPFDSTDSPEMAFPSAAHRLWPPKRAAYL
jgi:O-methyltransferase involved in polyketide biosynthesis